jgi:hypothetical protein
MNYEMICFNIKINENKKKGIFKRLGKFLFYFFFFRFLHFYKWYCGLVKGIGRQVIQE